jgi:DNA-directed RNA polymerase subunit E'/Rpb7
MAARMSLFKQVFLDQRVSLKPTELQEATADMDAFLVGKIRKDLEGQCCMHGYVQPGSTQILARSMGQAEHGHFTGDFLFHCKVKIQCLLPHADQIVEARILKMNKLGGYALIVDEGRLHEAMRILIPRDLHLGNTEFDALQVGQGVRIRLLRSRFQSKDAFIQSVGVYEGLLAAADGPTPSVLPDVMETEIAPAPATKKQAVLSALPEVTEETEENKAASP